MSSLVNVSHSTHEAGGFLCYRTEGFTQYYRCKSYFFFFTKISPHLGLFFLFFLFILLLFSFVFGFCLFFETTSNLGWSWIQRYACSRTKGVYQYTWLSVNFKALLYWAAFAPLSATAHVFMRLSHSTGRRAALTPPGLVTWHLAGFIWSF